VNSLVRPAKALMATAVLAAGLLAGTTAPAGAFHDTTEVLLSGLSSPKGLALAPNGELLVGQGALGPPGPILLHDPETSTTEEITEPFNVVDVAAGNGQGWALTGGGEPGQEGAATLYRFDGTGTLTPVADIAAYQATDPDPFDLEEFPEDSNPYGLGSLPNGDALVVDAANNDLLRVTPAGDITTVARFDVELVKTDHLPREFGLPPRIPAEAVPTSVSVASDGSIFVGELKGFPFRPGSSRIWRIAPGAEGATCSVSTPDPACRTAARGFTSIQDIVVDLPNRALYVYELAEGGVLALEAGFETGEFPPAVLLKVTGAGERTELAPGELSQAGGLVVDGDDVYVTDGLFFGGRLLEVANTSPAP